MSENQKENQEASKDNSTANTPASTTLAIPTPESTPTSLTPAVQFSATTLEQTGQESITTPLATASPAKSAIQIPATNPVVRRQLEFTSDDN